MDSWGIVALIMCCGLFADNMVTKGKLNELKERVDKIDKASGTTTQ